MKKCENCEEEHGGEYGSGRFCSNKCARGFSTKANRSLINEKVRIKLTGTGNPNITKICSVCTKSFTRIYARRYINYCSLSCAAKAFAQSSEGKAHHVKIGLISSLSQNKRSKNETMFANLCGWFFNNIECNKSIFNGWDADVIIHDLKIAVLWNGKWHYKKITKKHSVLQVQTRDKIKIKEIKKLGYTPYIIKDMGRFNSKFVCEQFELFLNKIKRSGVQIPLGPPN